MRGDSGTGGRLGQRKIRKRRELGVRRSEEVDAKGNWNVKENWGKGPLGGGGEMGSEKKRGSEWTRGGTEETRGQLAGTRGNWFLRFRDFIYKCLSLKTISSWFTILVKPPLQVLEVVRWPQRS